MKSGQVYLVLLWHMHQPDYRHPKTKMALLPWVRMHAAKDYADMPALLEEFPGIKQNFNLTPILLEQIVELEKMGQDELMRIAHRGEEGWDLQDRKYLIRQCFMANRSRQIKPLPRYEDLFQRVFESEGGEEAAVERMSSQDFQDLVVLFHLAWTDPRWFVRYPELGALRDKGSDFDIRDIESVISIQMAIVREVIPIYRRMAERGQIELSTTPYYHPIAPLLVDVACARESQPGIQLPGDTFAGEEDLAWQIDAAIRLHEGMMGNRPAGIWAAEGAISEKVVQMFAARDFSWVIGDQLTLERSLQMAGIRAKYAHHLTWHYSTANTALTILFRDALLSDMIAFTYSTWDPGTAAADLTGRILSVGASFAEMEEMPVVVICLDGENAWENYESDGVPFLRAFYKLIENEPRIECVTASEFIKRSPMGRKINNIQAGSWIKGNLDVWLGHRQDRAAWEMVAGARRALLRAGPRMGPGAHQAAWRHLMAAEGSDWTWWYGDDYKSPERPIFDELFRKHIGAIYEIIGEPAPRDVSETILNL